MPLVPVASPIAPQPPRSTRAAALSLCAPPSHAEIQPKVPRPTAGAGVRMGTPGEAGVCGTAIRLGVFGHAAPVMLCMETQGQEALLCPHETTLSRRQYGPSSCPGRHQPHLLCRQG